MSRTATLHSTFTLCCRRKALSGHKLISNLGRIPLVSAGRSPFRSYSANSGNSDQVPKNNEIIDLLSSFQTPNRIDSGRPSDAQDYDSGKSPSASTSSTPKTHAKTTSASRWHLHVFSSPNNVRLTLTDDKNNPVIVVTAGMLGYTNVRRSTYEAAYQTCSNLLDRMKVRNLNPGELEIIFKGFGQGRDAVSKFILGLEGAWLRPKIKMVRDVTKLKFGGTRGRKPRRL